MIRIALLCHTQDLDKASEAFFALPRRKLEIYEERTLLYILEQALLQRQLAVAHNVVQRIASYELSEETKLQVDCCIIRTLLLEKNWERAGEILHNYPLEMLTKETTPLNYLYGCWLYVTEGKEIAHIHFSGFFEVTYPRTWSLLSHFLNGKLDTPPTWFDKAFLWEKRQLYSQLTIFYACIGDQDNAQRYHNLELQEKETT